MLTLRFLKSHDRPRPSELYKILHSRITLLLETFKVLNFPFIVSRLMLNMSNKSGNFKVLYCLVKIQCFLLTPVSR